MNPIIKPISVVLKEARQNKGISLEDAHKATKIHYNILRAMEEGTTLGLSHVYVKSYIKIYAKYLEISQKELDRYFHPVAVLKEKKVRLDFHSKTKGIKVKSLSKLSSLASLRFQIKPFRKIISISVAVFVLLLLIGLFRNSQRKDAIVLEKVTIDDSAVVPQVAQKNTEEPKEIKEAIPSEINDDILRLTIFAKEDTWMQIKNDEEVVFKKILKKSNSETWQANESLELWIANAGTVELELNGKVLAPLGKRGKLIRSAFITKDGVVVKR
ncbi:helix-turn-helix domain-containing protein [Candidatus Omnitrophota bacterium]